MVLNDSEEFSSFTHNGYKWIVASDPSANHRIVYFHRRYVHELITYYLDDDPKLDNLIPKIMREAIAEWQARDYAGLSLQEYLTKLGY